MKNSTWKAEPSGACAVTDDGFELTIFATRSATWKGEKWRGVVRHIAVDGRAPVELFTDSFIEKAAAQRAVLVKLAEIRQRATEGLCLFLDKEPEKPRESSTGANERRTGRAPSANVLRWLRFRAMAIDDRAWAAGERWQREAERRTVTAPSGFESEATAIALGGSLSGNRHVRAKQFDSGGDLIFDDRPLANLSNMEPDLDDERNFILADAALPPVYRNFLVAALLDGEALKTIARRVGRSIESVKDTLVDALNYLADMYDRLDGRPVKTSGPPIPVSQIVLDAARDLAKDREDSTITVGELCAKVAPTLTRDQVRYALPDIDAIAPTRRGALFVEV